MGTSGWAAAAAMMASLKSSEVAKMSRAPCLIMLLTTSSALNEGRSDEFTLSSQIIFALLGPPSCCTTYWPPS